MSYMDYFQNTCSRNAEEEIAVIEGTCNSMCPEAEVILRKKEKMVHVLEVVGNEHKLVKRYARPAADTNLAVGHNLRPFYILKKTVDYLLFEVTKRTDVPTLVIYNFITDRLRAIRQDMIIQDLKPKLRIILLEPMIRFHTYYGYLLCEESINDYSPTLNRNFLLECLKTCLYCYDELDMKNTDFLDPLNINSLMDSMLTCSLVNDQQSLDRSLVEAIYVLTNLYDESPIWRLCRLKKSLRHAPPVCLAYRIAVASLQGNYVAVSKLIDNLCPLMFCSVAMFLPRIQRAGLRVICAAYGGRAGVPGAALRAWLRLPRPERALRHYGVRGDAGAVRCQRAAFREDAPLLPPNKMEVKHLEQKMNIDYILTYTHLDR